MGDTGQTITSVKSLLLFWRHVQWCVVSGGGGDGWLSEREGSATMQGCVSQCFSCPEIQPHCLFSKTCSSVSESSEMYGQHINPHSSLWDRAFHLKLFLRFCFLFVLIPKGRSLGRSLLLRTQEGKGGNHFITPVSHRSTSLRLKDIQWQATRS